MLLVNKTEGQKILDDEKDQSCRAIRPNGKGYLRVGSIQQVRDSRNFKAPYLCRILIYERDFTNTQSLTPQDCQRLGYETKAEYLAQRYNQDNPSTERVRYSFIRLGLLVELAQECEITPQTFGELWDYCKDCPSLAQGVEPQRVFEGCNIEDLETQFIGLQTNILGVYYNE